MANYLTTDTDLTSVADAIRTKGGTSAALAFPAGFVQAIGDIPTGGGGAVWTRPADWPDLDQLDISGGNIVYMTYSADEKFGFFDLTCKTSSGQYKVEIGAVSGSTFTAETTYNLNSNTTCRHYFGSALGGYKVVRVTGNLTSFSLGYNGMNSYDGVYRYSSKQGLLEVKGKVTNATALQFRGLAYLQRVYWYGASATSLSNSFRENPSLVLAELPYVVTSATTSMTYMFFQNPALIKVDTTGWDTSNVEAINHLFNGTTLLREFDASSFNTGSVTNFSSMFSGCYFLSELDVSAWDTSNGQNFSYMFYNCHSLKELNVSRWDTSAATNFNNMFGFCYQLRFVGDGIKNWETGSVTDFGLMFTSAYDVNDIDISGWDMTSGTNTNEMFRTCTSLFSVTLPDTLKVVGANMFNSARNLTEFHFLSTTPPTLGNTNAFQSMTDAGGKKIYVPYSADHSVLNAYKTASNWSTYASYIYEEAAP